MTFTELGLSAPILKGISELGFESPTPVQQQAIPAVLEGNRDLVALAQTGTGKTAAFGLPLLEMIDPQWRGVQALVICPTRELCLQISRDLENFAKYVSGVKVLPVYGGSSIDVQIRALRKGVNIVVATPGRLMDLMDRGVVDLENIGVVVLDEADEMLNMGFQEDIDTILSETPATRRTLLFSATMPKEVERISRKYMTDPLEISVGKRNSGATTIKHTWFCIKEKDRYTALRRMLDFHPDIFGLVFCRTRNETQQIADKLQVDGYNALPLHGDMSQQQRDSAMKKFRDRTIQVLVATDVAARGIDVDSISHVINYNLPDDIENYTHRSGRTGRAGKTGESLVIVNQREVHRIKDISRQMNVAFEQGMIPSAEQIVERQIYRFVQRIAETKVDEASISRYLSRAYSVFEGMSNEEIIMKVIGAEFAHFSQHYQFASDINVQVSGPRDSGKRHEGGQGGDGPKNRNVQGRSQRFFMSAGERDNMNKGALVRLICSSTGITSADIGRIDVMDKYSFFEVTEDAKQSVLDHVSRPLRYGHIDVTIEASETRPESHFKKFYGGKGSYGKKGGGGNDRQRDNHRSGNKGRRDDRRR